MKHKFKFTRLWVASLLLLFGFTTNAWGDLNCDLGNDMTKVTIKGSWDSWSEHELKKDNGEHYYGTIYIPADGSYNFGVNTYYNNSSTATYRKRTDTFDSNTSGPTFYWGCADYQSDATLKTKTASSNYVKTQFDVWGRYGINNNATYTGAVKVFQTAIDALSASLEAGSTSLTSGGTTTMTASGSGGTGTLKETFKVTQNGVDVTASTFNTSTKKFTAPSVTEVTDYIITVTYSENGDLKGKIEDASKSVTVTVTPVSYTVTFGPKSGCEAMGSVMAKVDNNGITSGSSVYGGKSVVFSYSANAGYKFTQWVNASGAQLGTGATYTISSLAKDEKVYAEFAEIQYTITMEKNRDAAGTITPNSQQTLNYFTPIALSYTTNTGYTFSNWSSNTPNVEIFDDNGTTKMRIKSSVTANGTATVTANYNENDIPVNVVVASGDENKGSVTSSSVTAHPETGVTITAEPKAGYYFTGWTSENGDIKFTDKNNASTTIKTTTTGTVIAHFAGKYVFRGSLKENNDPTGGMPGWSNNDPIEFTNGTASVSYNLQANKTYKFKLRDKSTNDGYAGYQNSGNIAMNGAYHSFNGTNDVYLATQGAGSYQFDIAFDDNGTPKVKVTGPTSYTITFGKGTGGSTISATSSIDGTITTGQYVKSGANVTFSQTAATGYHFVEWNTQADGQGTKLGTDATLVLNNVTENKTVYSIYAKTDYNITYPSGTNYTIEKTKDIANYQDNVTFKATPKDGYRLEVTAKDASNNNVTLNHNDFSYDYSFSMPASNVTISVTEYPYLIGGNFTTGGESFDSEKYTFDENHQHTFTLNAQTSYKFKIYNDTYEGTDTYGSDHYMGMNGDWVIDHTSLNSEVTCAGAACFVIKTGIAGQYTIKVKTGENNKPVVDIIYPNVSKLVYNGNDYPFTEVSSGVYKAGPLSLAANTTYDEDIRMYWEGTCIKNDNNSTMTASSHTDWGMERYTEGTYYIKLTTNTTEFAKSPDNYYFYYKPTEKKLSAEYPSYWRGTGLGWEFAYPMEFVNNVATLEYNVTTSGTKEMKVVVDGQYWSKDQTISTSTNNIQFATGVSAAFKYSVDESMTGTYTFTFNRSDHQMSVGYPDTEQFDITYTDAEGTKTIKAGPNGGRGISAANKPGYKFVRWELYPDDINVIDVAGHELTRQTTTVYGKAAGGSITAIYTNEHFIYFKNIPNWSDVYVQFYSTPYFHGSDASTDKNKGTGTGKNNDNIVNGTVYHMNHIDKTDIWYFDYSSFASAATEKHTVAFTDSKQEKHDFFDQCQVVYRGDFGECANMMVPINYIDQYLNVHEVGDNEVRTCYYGQGHWMKYDAAENAEMGIKLHIYEYKNDKWTDITDSPFDFLADNDGSYSSHISGINLPSANYKYHVKLEGCATGGTWYGNTGKMTSAECTNWVMSINTNDMEFEAKSAGPYTFRLTTGDGQLKLSAEYPLVENDFRVIHTEGGNTHITGITYKHANAKADTASFYFNISETSPVFKVQKCTNASQDNWADVSGATFTNPTTTGVYNFIFSHEEETVTIQKTEPYTGNYYVRCEALNGGLENYEANADNRMNYTTANPTFAANDQQGYNYYKTRWITIGKNVSYTVANDYSKNISATMTGDGIIGNDTQTLPADANVRFTWNSNTNALSRAYIKGSSNAGDKFVQVYGDNVYSNPECTTSLTAEAPGLFKDNQDWVYEYTMYAKTGATATVMTSYNDHQQYLISNQAVFSSTKDADIATLRTLYDFKTNRFVAAWTPNGQIDAEYSISADIMLMRNGQQQADQLTFGENGKITGADKTVYGAVKFDKSLMELKDGMGYQKYDRSIFWISFPFDVRLNEVFGLGQYGKYWIIRYYDGAERASKGWFQETKTFWKTVSVEEREHGGTDGKGFILNANEGYNLVLDYTAVLKDLYPNGATENYLFFPSKDKLQNIPTSLQTESITYPALTCTITSPEDRTNEDSNWRVIGVPSYADPGTITSTEGIKFFYAWNRTNNTLGVEKVPETNPRGGDNKGEFQSLHAYMVQFAGTINWKNLTIDPNNPATAPLFAQTEKEEYSLRLELQQEGKKVDQAYIDLTDEATEEFDLNLDITKLMYSTSQIYSFVGHDKVAANSLPVRDIVVPLCVTAAADGTYTIALPDGTEGLNVTLYDVTAGKETNMIFDGYTVNLDKGEYNDRFLLNISVPRVPTNIRNAKDEWSVDGKTQKLLINDQIYLINAGRVYNVLGVEE